MNLPQHVHDQSILQCEPLCTHIALYERCETRSQRSVVISTFVKAMEKDDQAALACKEWAHLAFEKTHSRDQFGVADNEKRLYEAFFLYYLELSQGKRKEAEKYRCHVVRNGIGLMKPRRDDEVRQVAQHHKQEKVSKARGEGQRRQRSSRLQGVSGPNEDRVQAETHRPHQGRDAEMTSTLEMPSHSVTDSAVTQVATHSRTDVQLSSLAEKKSKRSTSKKEKKRKASSQKPYVITPSDASEDERKPSETPEVAIAHRPKRITPDPPCPPHESRETEDLPAKMISARRPKITNLEDTSISQGSSSLTTFQFGKSSSCPQMARRSAGPPLSRRKRNNKKLSNAPKRLTRTHSKLGRLRKLKSVADLPTRPRKRLRCSSMTAIDAERRGVSASTRARFISEPIVKQSFDTGPPPPRENVRMEAKTRKKRTRHEFEMGSIPRQENTEANFSELLGPDIRPSRPLPRKVRSERSVPHVDEDISTQCELASLQQADQLLRDAARNALALLSEGIAPDMPDWTQDNEQDECDDPAEQDETNDTQSAVVSAASVLTTKPPVPAPPRIWAQSRQEVCESFEHFRSYHSGVYSKDDIVKGYLLGAHAASRDVFHHNGKLIISHGGGKSESVLECRKGRKRYQLDQDQEATDTSVRALLKTWKDRRPLVLLADDKYALFPYDLTSGNYTYVVLGLYWISHAWAECQPSRDGSGRIVRWKFAFQWCEGQGDPWWAPRQDTNITPQAPTPFCGSSMCPTNGPSHLASTSENPNVQCESCQEQSSSIYEQGWMCLNPRCEKFWSIDDQEPEQLDYHSEFLKLLPQRFERLPDIIPKRVLEIPGGITTTFACSKGWHCAKCGRLSCRFKWEHWECSNCGFKHEVKGRVREPKEFWHQRPPKELLHSRIGKDSGIIACRFEPIHLGEHKGFTNRLTFILPYDRGKIHVILGTPMSNGNADYIFQLYQQQASNGELKLRRYPLRNHRARGQLLTNYFSQNSGEPYQYVGGTGNTVPFDQAPECVQRALAVIKERAHLALHADVPFNEILSAAYMERQKMSFHSDSEKGLGPVVASLSLGSAALMHFRPHASVGELRGKSAYALTLVLRHGDVLIMDGEGVQKYYEHTVVPMNFRIAATARCIGST